MGYKIKMRQIYQSKLIYHILFGRPTEQFYARAILRNEEKLEKLKVEPLKEKRVGQVLPTKFMDFDYRTKEQRLGKDYRFMFYGIILAIVGAVYLTSSILEMYVN